MQENLLALPPQTELNGYVIDSVLGQGGFGVVYKAWHSRLEEWVVIKEFLPSELAGRVGNTIHPHDTERNSLFRECLDRFVIEGKTLVKLKHNHVVRCRDLFAANGTEYLVMDFEDGMPLDELIRAKEEKGEKYTERQLLPILISIAEGLDYIHSKGVLHRDIKPGNIFIRKENAEPVIIDFGAAKQNFAEVSQSQAPFTEFYAPIEQIEGIGEAAPTIDVHAFGAMMYRMIAGKIGPSAGKRALAFATGKEDSLESAKNIGQGHYSEEFLALIDDCLAFQAMNRPQSMSEVKKKLLVLREDAQGEPPVNETTGAYVEKEIESVKKNNGTAKSIKASEGELVTNELDKKTDDGSIYAYEEKEFEGGEAKDSLSLLVEDESHSDLSKKPKKVYFVAVAIAVLIGIVVLVYQQYVQSQYDKLMLMEKEVMLLHEDLSKYSNQLKEDVFDTRFGLVLTVNFESRLKEAPHSFDDRYQFFKDFTEELRSQLVSLEESLRDANSTYESAIDRYHWQRKRDEVSMELFQKAEKIGHPYAAIELANIYYDGKIVGEDVEKANELWAQSKLSLYQAASQGNKHAQYLYAGIYMYGKGEKKDYGLAIEWYEKAAGQQYALAQYELGVAYLGGYGVEKDYSQAIQWFKKSAAQAYPRAHYKLGRLYQDGKGVTRNYSTALDWYHQSAELGYLGSMHQIGWMYQNGFGVEQDYSKALDWYRKAASENYPSSLAQLGWMYEKGMGVTLDYKEAMIWYEKAAEFGSTLGFNQLGVFYLDGKGVPKDYSQALSWFRRAAEKDHAFGQNNLGYMHENGYGVEKNYIKALKWYRKSARQGNKTAQGHLTRLGETW